MKLLRFIPLVALAFVLGSPVARAEEPKTDTKGKCCLKAEKAGEVCKHECCVEAAKEHKNCEKCGGTNAPKK